MVRLGGFAAFGLILAVSSFAVAQQPAKPKGKDWHGKDLQKRDLRTENLAYANLDDTKLFLANLKEMNLQGATFRNADMTSASLDGANLTGADLRDATIDSAGFQGTILVKANLEGLDLGGASFQGADLRGANLKKVRNLKDMTRADFRGADLRGANLLGAVDYSGNSAKFQGAKYDENTRFPKGFDVEGSGAKLTPTEDEPAADTPASEPTDDDPAPGKTAKTDRPAKADPAADAKRPEGAPLASVVKELLETEMWAPPAQGGTMHTYTYKSFKYGKPRPGNFRTDGIPAGTDTIVYPVQLHVEIVREFTDGTTKDDVKKQTYVFFQDEFENWRYTFKSND